MSLLCHYTEAMKLLRLMRLAKLLRVARAGRIFQRWETR